MRYIEHISRGRDFGEPAPLEANTLYQVLRGGDKLCHYRPYRIEPVADYDILIGCHPYPMGFRLVAEVRAENQLNSSSIQEPASPAAQGYRLFQKDNSTTLDIAPSMEGVISMMSKMVAAVERGMTTAGQGNLFSVALQAGLIEAGRWYPFLDPSSAEFEYRNGEILFEGSAQPSEFAKGLVDALHELVSHLTYRLNDKNTKIGGWHYLPSRNDIAIELTKVEAEYSGLLHKLDLVDVTEQISSHKTWSTWT